MPSSPSEPVQSEPGVIAGSGLFADPEPLLLRRQNWLKRLLPQSMFGRSLLLIVIPLVLVQIIAAIVFYARHWEAVSYRLSADVAGDIELVIDAMHKMSTPAERRALFDNVARTAELIIWFGAG
jgi:two-component system, OmpR family, osmolarity sensor histidine kinase EnvZ